MNTKLMTMIVIIMMSESAAAFEASKNSSPVLVSSTFRVVVALPARRAS